MSTVPPGVPSPGADSREPTAGARRVELLLPMRTVLLVAATAGVIAAFAAIGDTFLVVFVGIFLALVFEYPVRFVMAKTGMSRGLAATVTVLGTALAVSCSRCCSSCRSSAACATSSRIFPRPSSSCASRTSSRGSATPALRRTCSRAEQVSASVPDAISAVLGIAGAFFSVFLACFTILFICLFLLTDIANLKRALASVLMPGEDERWLGVWERVTASVSRWAIGVVVIATIAGTTQG